MRVLLIHVNDLHIVRIPGILLRKKIQLPFIVPLFIGNLISELAPPITLINPAHWDCFLGPLGLLGPLWDCCGTALGPLWDCCGTAAGLL